MSAILDLGPGPWWYRLHVTVIDALFTFHDRLPGARRLCPCWGHRDHRKWAAAADAGGRALIAAQDALLARFYSPPATNPPSTVDPPMPITRPCNAGTESPSTPEPGNY